ncbi:hypothetical protein NKH18_32560 [Streptomyces sp. M10(2022)]
MAAVGSEAGREHEAADTHTAPDPGDSFEDWLRGRLPHAACAARARPSWMSCSPSHAAPRSPPRPSWPHWPR